MMLKKAQKAGWMVEVKQLQRYCPCQHKGLGVFSGSKDSQPVSICPTRAKGIQMANPKCVALNTCEVKDIFDKGLKSALFKQIKQTVRTHVDKTSGLTFDDNCKDGWSLSVTVLSLKVDSPDKPTTIEVTDLCAKKLRTC